MDYKLENNQEISRYQYNLENGEKAICEYIYVPNKNTIYFTHTEVPTDMENKGIASSLVKEYWTMPNKRI